MNEGPARDLPPGDESAPRDAALWRLLGRAPMAEPDAWFVTRTLARCRGEKRAAFGRIWRWAVGGGLGVCCAVTLLGSQIHSAEKMQKQQKKVQEAFEVMASIDNSDTDTSAPTSSWQDSSL